jgi:hypothetical protein
MVRVAALVLLFASPAVAEPDTVEAQRRALALDPNPVEGRNVQAFAQLGGGTADTTTADAALGGEYVVAAPLCDRMRLGGQARVAWSHGESASAEQWASTCLFRGALEINHRLEWDVRSSLLAAPQLRAGENRRETASLHFRALAAPAWGGVFSGGEVTITATMLWSSSESLSTRQVLDVAALRYSHDQVAPWGEHLPMTVDFLDFGGEFIEPFVRASPIEKAAYFWFARMENVQIDGAYVSSAIGFTAPGDKELYPDVMLGVAFGTEQVHGYVRASYDPAWTPDGYLTLDGRLTAGIATRAHGFTLGLDTAVAHTDIIAARTDDDAMTSDVMCDSIDRSAVTGGASLSASRRLSDHLAATVLVDAARTFYAPDATTLDFSPRWATRAFATLQATLGR